MKLPLRKQQQHNDGDLYCIRDANGSRIARDLDEAEAASIVRAVNGYEAAVAMLRKHEYSSMSAFEEAVCPECRDDPHEKDCILAALLKESEEG